MGCRSKDSYGKNALKYINVEIFYKINKSAILFMIINMPFYLKTANM